MLTNVSFVFITESVVALSRTASQIPSLRDGAPLGVAFRGAGNALRVGPSPGKRSLTATTLAEARYDQRSARSFFYLRACKLDAKFPPG